MITTFDDDATIYMPALTGFGQVWNWLSTCVSGQLRTGYSPPRSRPSFSRYNTQDSRRRNVQDSTR